MGSPSYFTGEEIQIKDLEGLKSYLKFWADTFPESLYCIKNQDVGMELLNRQNNVLSFNAWDGYKLISYWYDSEVAFLHGLARYIEGYANFEFEDDDEKASICFENGKCNIKIGVMDWSDNTPLSLMNAKNSYRNEVESYKKLKKFMLVNSL